MSEPTSDQKIELLVRSVLEAVDARLADVRNEVQQLATDVSQRLQVLEQRVDVEVANCAGTANVAGMPATSEWVQQFEAMHHRTLEATNQRLDAMNAVLDQLRDGPQVPIPALSTPMMVGLDAMSAPLKVPPITGQQPVLLDEPPSLLAQDDTVADEPVADALVTDVVSAEPEEPEQPEQPEADEMFADEPAAEPVAAEETTVDEGRTDDMAADDTAHGEMAFDESPAPIDLNQLADLLSERLSSISLPPR